MRILFVMHYPGYLRYYDSTVSMLAERGHSVHLVFESVEKQREGLEALSPLDDGIVVLGTLPKRTDLWAPFARAVRGTVDYVRYLDPYFADAHYLRGRMRKVVPAPLGVLTRFETLPKPMVGAMIRGLVTLEEAIPSGRQVELFLEAVRPDVVLVTPLVTDASPQTDVVKSARRLGIPTGLCVASWDHLTTKGMIRCIPDAVMVWNETQKIEATSLHGVPPSRVVVTGAQPFDRWFGRQPTATREEFCRRVDLPPDRPFVLFVGSTASISTPDAEAHFVRQWIGAIRASADPAVRDLAVLIRPHPYNPGSWGSFEVAGLGAVAVWPRHGANPVNEGDRADYFHSLYHCAAVVGINTSAMIEAAIVGRPVHTILAGEFDATQLGTLHFRYLLPANGGFLRVASDLREHVALLADTLDRSGEVQNQLRRFLRTFVRPHGLDTPCTPVVVEAIEKLGHGVPPPSLTPGARIRVVRAMLSLGLGLVATRRRGLGASVRRAWGALRAGLTRLTRSAEGTRRVR